jgi:hypothetical protein
MEKKTYKKLSMKVIMLHQRTHLLAGSGEEPEQEPDNTKSYGGWLQ